MRKRGLGFPGRCGAAVVEVWVGIFLLDLAGERLGFAFWSGKSKENSRKTEEFGLKKKIEIKKSKELKFESKKEKDTGKKEKEENWKIKKWKWKKKSRRKWK